MEADSPVLTDASGQARTPATCNDGYAGSFLCDQTVTFQAQATDPASGAQVVSNVVAVTFALTAPPVVEALVQTAPVGTVADVVGQVRHHHPATWRVLAGPDAGLVEDSQTGSSGTTDVLLAAARPALMWWSWNTPTCSGRRSAACRRGWSGRPHRESAIHSGMD